MSEIDTETRARFNQPYEDFNAREADSVLAHHVYRLETGVITGMEIEE